LFFDDIGEALETMQHMEITKPEREREREEGNDVYGSKETETRGS
jgi:hypothetical protein